MLPKDAFAQLMPAEQPTSRSGDGHRGRALDGIGQTGHRRCLCDDQLLPVPEAGKVEFRRSRSALSATDGDDPPPVGRHGSQRKSVVQAAQDARYPQQLAATVSVPEAADSVRGHGQQLGLVAAPMNVRPRDVQRVSFLQQPRSCPFEIGPVPVERQRPHGRCAEEDAATMSRNRLPAVRREAGVEHLGHRLGPDCQEFPVSSQAPDAQVPVGRAGYDAVGVQGRERATAHRVRMASQQRDFPSVAHLPDPDRAVFAGTDQQPPVGREIHIQDGRGVSGQHGMSWLDVCVPLGIDQIGAVPQLDAAVRAGRGDQQVVRREPNIVDRLPVVGHENSLVPFAKQLEALVV